MKKIKNMFKIDLVLTFRDKIVLYMAAGPLLLALVLLAVMGSSSAATVSYAATPDVPREVLENLSSMADVRLYASYDEVRARVERADSAAGVYMKDKSPALLFEGGESEEFKVNSALLLSRAIAGDLPVFESRPVDSAGNAAAEIAYAMLLLLCIFLGGAVAGFNIVAERENGTIRALAVSPLTRNGFLFSRTAFALLLSLINVALCSLILGKAGRLPQIIPAALASAPVCGIVALILGGASSNQIAATGTLKILMPVCMIIPVSSVFVPEGFKFLYWWIPFYWQYGALTGGLDGKIDLAACAFLFLTGSAWLIIILKLTVRKLGLRYNYRRCEAWNGTGGR